VAFGGKWHSSNCLNLDMHPGPSLIAQKSQIFDSLAAAEDTAAQAKGAAAGNDAIHPQPLQLPNPAHKDQLIHTKLQLTCCR
jgi:hypothetical protein